jgi:hypothetical protein
MDRATMQLHAGRERLLMRVEAGKKRQQRRMDIDHPVAPRFDEFMGQEPHEAGEADELDAGAFQPGIEREVEGLARGVLLVVQHRGLDAVLLRAEESGCVRPVRKHEDDFGRVGRILRRLDKGGHVGAASGNERGDAAARHQGAFRSSLPS